MVQVFGKRIIGGIGAPDPRMSESFGTGVNTALSQRESRQGMAGEAQRQRILEQEFAWKNEDREEAKRRQAAAEAAAAAARARGAAMRAQNVATIAGLRTTQPFFSVGSRPATAGATAPAAPTAGVSLPRSMGTAAPAAGGTISGGSGSSSSKGGPGADRLQSAGVTAPVPGAFINSYGEVDTMAAPQGRPGNFAAQAPALRAAARTDGSQNAQLELELAQSQLDMERARFATNPRASGEDVDYIVSLQRQVDALKGVAPFSTYGSDSYREPRGLAAVEGPETSATATRQYTAGQAAVAATQPAVERLVTINGPNGPITVPTDTAPDVPVAPTTPGGLSFAGMGAANTGATAPVGFGERLGAAPSMTEMFLADVGAAPPGQVDFAALTAAYDGPLYDPMFAQLAEQERAAFVYAMEDAAARGDMNGYFTAAKKVREQELLILTQQLVVGIDEANNFNSPQRLSAVASMVYGGRDIFVAPNGDGTADIYQDQELVRTGADLNEFASGLRSLIDDEYRTQMAQTAAERGQFVFEEQTKADIAAQRDVEIARGKALNDIQIDQLRAYLRTQGLLPPEPAEYEFVEGPDNSSVTLINKRTGAQEITYLFGVDPTNGQTTVQELRQ